MRPETLERADDYNYKIKCIKADIVSLKRYFEVEQPIIADKVYSLVIRTTYSRYLELSYMSSVICDAIGTQYKEYIRLLETDLLYYEKALETL